MVLLTNVPNSVRVALGLSLWQLSCLYMTCAMVVHCSAEGVWSTKPSSLKVLILREQ